MSLTCTCRRNVCKCSTRPCESFQTASKVISVTALNAAYNLCSAAFYSGGFQPFFQLFKSTTAGGAPKSSNQLSTAHFSPLPFSINCAAYVQIDNARQAVNRLAHAVVLRPALRGQIVETWWCWCCDRRNPCGLRPSRRENCRLCPDKWALCAGIEIKLLHRIAHGITLGGGAVYILKQSLQARARAGIHIHISVGLAAVAVANLHALGRGRLGGVCREPQ